LSSSPDVVAEKEDSPSVKDRSVKWILKNVIHAMKKS
jgi:hypothetical protein